MLSSAPQQSPQKVLTEERIDTVDGEQAFDLVESLELADDERAMSPRASECHDQDVSV